MLPIFDLDDEQERILHGHGDFISSRISTALTSNRLVSIPNAIEFPRCAVQIRLDASGYTREERASESSTSSPLRIFILIKNLNPTESILHVARVMFIRCDGEANENHLFRNKKNRSFVSRRNESFDHR